MNLIVIVITIFNSSSTSSVILIRSIRNLSIEFLMFFNDWFINRTVYRTIIKIFHSITIQCCLSFQYKSYLLKQSSRSKQKQFNSSNISLFINDISSQSEFIVFRLKIKYFMNIDDSLVFNWNNKEFTSTIRNINDFIFENQFKSINQQIIETFAEKIIYENFINFDIMSTNFNI